MSKKYNLKLAVWLRFIRTFIPQIPALTAQALEYAKLIPQLPGWVVPTLSFLGVVATAADKYLRDIGK